MAAFHAFLYAGSMFPFEGRGRGAKAFKWGVVRRGNASAEITWLEIIGGGLRYAGFQLRYHSTWGYIAVSIPPSSGHERVWEAISLFRAGDERAETAIRKGGAAVDTGIMSWQVTTVTGIEAFSEARTPSATGTMMRSVLSSGEMLDLHGRELALC
jgi:hypothetical protein